jgi:hypothetical protein
LVERVVYVLRRVGARHLLFSFSEHTWLFTST